MNLSDARQTLATLIHQGLAVAEKRARAELSPATIYAVTLYSAPGFRGLGVAVNTREALDRTRGKHAGLDADLLRMLQSHPDLLSRAVEAFNPDPEVSACEWEYMYSDLPHQDASEMIDDLYEYFYALDWEAGPISDWLFETISIGILDFAKSRPEDNSWLLGLQFSDPSVVETRMMERVSELVNSPYWHTKVRAAGNALRGMS